LYGNNVWSAVTIVMLTYKYLKCKEDKTLEYENEYGNIFFIKDAEYIGVLSFSWKYVIKMVKSWIPQACMATP